MRKICLLTALFTGLAAPALAEEDTLVVTATRTPIDARVLPADVTIIDAEEALSRGDATLSQALASTPGVNVSASGGPGQQTSLFLGGANSEHTLVLFDGLRINDPSSPKSAFDAGQDQLGALTRIEIVEGPMSAVYGSDAIGGVINQIARRGGDGAFNARMDLSGGSFGTATAAAGADGTLGAFRYAVTAEGFATEGHDLVPERMSTHTGEDDGAQMWALTGAFDLALSNVFALDLLVRTREAQAEFDPFVYAPPTYTEQRAEDSDLEISRNDLDIARLGATWALSENFSLRASYGGIDQSRAQSDDGVGLLIYDGQRRFADLTIDWRAGAVGALTELAIAGGVSQEEEEVDISELFDPSFPPPSVVIADQESQSAFVTAQGRLNQLTLTAALRADDYDGFGTETTWRAGASYDVNAYARIYAAYGTSFRAPTLYERFVSFGDPTLAAEEGESWEAGADLRVPAFGQDNGLEFGLLYRSTEIDNLIDFSGFNYANVDRAEIDTAEARVAARPLDWLTAHLAYVYTDAEDATTGAELRRRPEETWHAGISVEHGAFSSTLSWRQIGERSDFLYGDDGFSLGIGDTPAYDLVRLSASYAFLPGMSAYVAVDNVLDEDYEPANAFAGAPLGIMAGLRLRTP